MNTRVINTKSVYPSTTYSHAVRVGETIYVAGQVARDKAGQSVGKGDIAAQTEQVFRNLQAILADAGCTLDEIVKTTTFTLDPRYRGAIAEVRARFFKDYLPPNTFLVVSGLGEPEFLVEIEAIAVIRS